MKSGLRTTWSLACARGGLGRLTERFGGPRLVILYGHAVADPELNGHLAPPMKISAARLEGVLTRLGRRFDLVTVSEGMERLTSGSAARSMVALTMDDGYRDNLHVLVPLLERCGAKATVFLESGAVVERRLPWLHALDMVVAELGVPGAAAGLAERLPPQAEPLRAATSAERVKRILKYDADREERRAALDGLIASFGGDPAAYLDRTYLSHDEARALAASDRIEIGGHTVDHPVLARLTPEEQRREIERGRGALVELLGAGASPGSTFAYPYGRTWDVGADAPLAVREAGYRWAVTTMAGANVAGIDPHRLRRWPVDDTTPLHLVESEAAGAFGVLRPLGLDMSFS